MDGLCYLATPYSKYPAGIQAAFEAAAALTGRLIAAGKVVYSPITHTHPAALHAGLDPLDHELWMPFDQHMMWACKALLIAQMDSWQDSCGVKLEIRHFQAMEKPLYFVDPKTLRIWEFA